MVICLERGADLHVALLMPLPLAVFVQIFQGATVLGSGKILRVAKIFSSFARKLKSLKLLPPDVIFQS